jgi:HSP20 family molecular chaperone IbpA
MLDSMLVICSEELECVQTEEGFEVRADMPGVKKEDITVRPLPTLAALKA